VTVSPQAFELKSVDILGHECCGAVEEVGPGMLSVWLQWGTVLIGGRAAEVTRVKIGDVSELIEGVLEGRNPRTKWPFVAASRSQRDRRLRQGE
jgi:hypothetical protein